MRSFSVVLVQNGRSFIIFVSGVRGLLFVSAYVYSIQPLR